MQARAVMLLARTLLLTALMLAMSSPAAAYVRKTTHDGTPQAWGGGCPALVVRIGGPPPYDVDGLGALLGQAAAAWQRGPGTCAVPPITVTTDADDEPIGQDYENTVVWRPAGWCSDPDHGDDEVCLSPNVAAVTTTYYYERGERAGEIVETDIEINGAQPFAARPGEAGYDVLSALVHEVGHALGFDHSCGTVPGAAPAVDDRGRPVPSCFPSAALPVEVREATMYPYLRTSDPGPQTPQDDELAGLCAIYRGRDQRCAVEPAGCGCAGGGGAGGLVVVLAALVARAGRRRSSRSTQQC